MWKIVKRFANLGPEFFQYTQPSPLQEKAKLVHINRHLQRQLGLDLINNDTWLRLMQGTLQLEDYPSLASVYMGHQFGVPVAQLGDGRALLMAEHCDPQQQVWELQLKGAGPTPYSRQGDGRAVLRSSIREYLASHALTRLAIPTTQALAIMTSEDLVYRELPEPAAVVLRVAPSFIRFGHFEFFAAHNRQQQLRQLFEFCCTHYYPEIVITHVESVVQFLAAVVTRTARLLAQWQAHGFVHGVMNTDNMSIVGLTLDYGPYAFMDSFAPEHIFNHSDSGGRYTYAQQPFVGWWNLYRLADALTVIYSDHENLEQVLASFGAQYNQYYLELMAAKLGLAYSSLNADLSVLNNLLQLLQTQHIDWCYFWRQLSYGEFGIKCLEDAYPQVKWWDWYLQLQAYYQHEPSITQAQRQSQMLAINPALLPRTHLLQNAIKQAEAGDMTGVTRLFNALSNPFTELDEFSDLYALPPAGANEVPLSCSS